MIGAKSVTGRLFFSNSGADKNFPVGKRDHVGLGIVVEKIGMHLRHGGAINEDDFNGLDLYGQRPRQ